MTSLNNYQRAIQIYQVLIAAAHNRQTLTYGLVGELIDFPPRFMAPPLEHLLNYCDMNNLPQITVLVVRQEEGTPSTGFPGTINPDEERERVFSFDWYKQPPLTEEHLQAASQGS